MTQASRTRYGVVLFAIALGIIHYIDRVAISKAASLVTAELHLTTEQMGFVFSAFTLAYALFEIPGGWLGDRLGPRKVLLRIVLFWSAFTAATGFAWSFVSLIVFRFMFGAGEAGGFPNITKMYNIWLPHEERGVAQGITWMCARWGGAFTPLLVVWMLTMMNWRNMFMVFALLGVVWVVFFYRWFRDDPAEHRGVNMAELELINASSHGVDGHAAIPWRRLFRHRSVLLLWLYYFCISYVWYFYITWMPKYMKEALQLNTDDPWIAFLGGLPLLFGGVGCFVGGIVARRLTNGPGTLSRSRRWIGAVGMIAAGVLILVATTQQAHPMWALLALGVSGFFNDLSMPGAWGACMDIGGKLAGSVSGSMNMMGNLGGALGPTAAAFLFTSSGNDWNVPLYVAASTYLVSAVCWCFIDSDQHLLLDHESRVS
ncbi:MAG: MFS transporter [Verrucomicrobiaceae bacterium]|nr:MFS transporter [Verrucomicrobiaceae bacterium]